MNTNTVLPKYLEKILRVANEINKLNDDGPIIFDDLDKTSAKPSRTNIKGNLDSKNKRLLSLMLNQNSFIHELFWRSYSICFVSNKANIHLPFSTSELIETLKILKNNSADLGAKFYELIKANGLLRISSMTHIEGNLIMAYKGCLAKLKVDANLQNEICNKPRLAILNSFLAINGFSPLKGNGLAKIYSTTNAPNEHELNFLVKENLVEKAAEYELENYTNLIDKFEKDNYDIEEKTHIKQLDYLIHELELLIKTIQAFENPISINPDVTPENLDYVLNQVFVKLIESEKYKHLHEALKLICSQYLKKDDESTLEEIDLEEIETNAGGIFLMDRGVNLYKIFETSLIYLKNYLISRKAIIEGKDNDIYFTLNDLARLSELSKRSIDNELLKEDTILKSPDKGYVSSVSSYKWLKKKERKFKWLDCIDVDSNEDLSFEYLHKLYSSFDSFLAEELDKEYFIKNKKFKGRLDNNDREVIFSALQLNENSGSKRAKEILSLFLERFKKSYKS